MKWSRKSSHAIQCDQYVITRYMVQGKDQFWLWRGSENAGVFGTASQAKSAAQKESA